MVLGRVAFREVEGAHMERVMMKRVAAYNLGELTSTAFSGVRRHWCSRDSCDFFLFGSRNDFLVVRIII